jgi:hypothetical protein
MTIMADREVERLDLPISWTPGGLWCAVLVTESGTTTRQLVRADWASESEARGFVERRLPACADDQPTGVTVAGYVIPATTRTNMIDRELVQTVTPMWNRAQRATLNTRGYVAW